MGRREAKAALFDAFAQVGRALASGRRVEILDVLANGERSVDRLAAALGLPVANVSQHLQVLRSAGLVARRRQGTRVIYALAAPEVRDFLRDLRALAASRLADVERLAEAYFGERDTLEPVTREELARRLRRGDDIVVLDVRPKEEFEAGHVPGAISVPVGELHRRLRRIPEDREVVAYCRGLFCAFAHEALAVLRERGYRARRLEDGLPEWEAAGFPVVRRAAG